MILTSKADLMPENKLFFNEEIRCPNKKWPIDKRQTDSFFNQNFKFKPIQYSLQNNYCFEIDDHEKQFEHVCSDFGILDREIDES